MIMSQAFLKIVGDGHVHLHPHFHLKLAFDCLVANLSQQAQTVWPGAAAAPWQLVFLAERRGDNFFERLKAGRIDPAAAGLEILSADEGGSLLLRHHTGGRLCLVAGRQIITRERLEILGLVLREELPDLLSAQEVLERIRQAGGVPVLPWALGKWWGARGRLIRQLILAKRRGELALGDSALRPRLWPEPIGMRQARARGLTILPGSDPLPLAGEERRMGAYGFVYEGPFDLEQPARAARALVAEQAAYLRPAGRRNNTALMLQRLYRLRLAKSAGQIT